MSRRVKGPDGIVHIVPDDATDAEVAGILESSQPSHEPRIGANLHQEAKIGAAPHPLGEDFNILGINVHVPGEAKPRADENMADVGSVGIPPEGVLMGPLQAGRALFNPALSMAGRAASGLSTLATHAAPIVKYEIAKHALMHYGRLPESAASIAAAAISGYKRGGAAKAVEAEAETAAAPAAAEPSPSSRPVPAPAEAPAASPVRPIVNPGTALQSAKDAFAKLGETPRPAEASNAGELIRRGVPPETAVAHVIKNRPAAPLSPAERLAQMPGAMSDAEVRAALDARNARGQIKSPSAQTARERRGY